MDYSGQQFDQYRLVDKLGQGGMATVYKAYDTRLERDVAIKVVRKESIPPEQLERILKRFEREAKALAKFLHPNIVPVYDYGEWQGAPYLVMAYLPGGTLKAHIGKPLPVDTALNWVIPIANALSYAHQRGVIHRDVKPSNILTTEDGSLMLSDFGIARILEESTTQLTATGMGVGTPEYMAPEQWQGKATEASDQYALGVVLYELLTGVKPFSAETPLAVALKVMSEPLPKPSTYVPTIPEAVEKVLFKALARDPQDRYESIEAFQKTLVHLIDEKQETGTGFKEQENVFAEKPAKDYQKTPTQDNDETFDVLGEEKKLSTPPLKTQHDQISVVKESLNKTGGVLGDNTSKASESLSRTSPADYKYLFSGEYGRTNNSKNRNWTLFAIIGIVIAVIIIFIVANEAQSRNDANLYKTAQVKEQATSQANLTATAQSAYNYFDRYVNEGTLVFQKDEYELEHVEDSFVEIVWVSELKNFALEVDVFSPYDSSVGTWDFGLMFRHYGKNDQFRLAIQSDETWDLRDRKGDLSEYLDGGVVDLNTDVGEVNHLRFLAVNNEGFLFINDQYISTMDLSVRSSSGSIYIATGLYNGNEIEGYSTRFENLKVYSLDQNGVTSDPTETIQATNTELVEQSYFTVEPVETTQVPESESISVNSKAFIVKKNYGSSALYDFQIVYENTNGWIDRDYSVDIEVLEDGGDCRFGSYESDGCKITTYNGVDYLVCTRRIYVSFQNYSWTKPPYNCLYEINLLADNQILHSFNYSYVFDN